MRGLLEERLTGAKIGAWVGAGMEDAGVGRGERGGWWIGIGDGVGRGGWRLRIGVEIFDQDGWREDRVEGVRAVEEGDVIRMGVGDGFRVGVGRRVEGVLRHEGLDASRVGGGASGWLLGGSGAAPELGGEQAEEAGVNGAAMEADAGESGGVIGKVGGAETGEQTEGEIEGANQQASHGAEGA